MCRVVVVVVVVVLYSSAGYLTANRRDGVDFLIFFLVFCCLLKLAREIFEIEIARLFCFSLLDYRFWYPFQLRSKRLLQCNSYLLKRNMYICKQQKSDI